MKSMHDRKFGFNVISLTQARPPKKGRKVHVAVSNHFDQYIKSSGFLDNAPFLWIGLNIRYGLKNDEKPSYQKIDKKYGELPVGIEIDVHDILEHKEDEAALYLLLYRSCLIVLIDIAKEYNLEGSYFEAELERLNKGGIVYNLEE